MHAHARGHMLGILATTVTFGLLLLLPRAAPAIPAFSRIYGKACNACHVAFPKLSLAGEEFRHSGYHRYAGGTEVPKVKPIRIHNQVYLPGIVPLSLLIEAGWDIRHIKEDKTSGEEEVIKANSFNPEEVELLAGGTLGRHVSYFLDFPMVEGEFEEDEGGFIIEGPEIPELAFIALNDILANDVLNLKFGIIELPLAFSPSHRRLSVAEYEIYAVNARDLLGIGSGAVGLENGAKRLRLKKGQIGVEFYGNFYPELTGIPDLIVRYHIGVINGTSINTDNNQEKTIYGRLEFTYLNQSIGFFGLYDPNTVDETPPAGFPGTKNRAWRLGPDISLRFLRETLNLFSQFLYGRDTSPTGRGVDLKYWGGFAEVDYKLPLGRAGDLMSLLRFDYVFTERFDDTTVGGSVRTKPRIFAVTFGLQYYFWQNFKFVVEYTYREEKEKLSVAESTRDNHRVRENIGTIRATLVF